MLIGITLLLVGIGQSWWGWMAKLQFLPSCLALNVGVIVGITLITLVLGRVYCSVICPMGVFQDLVIWLRRKLGGKHKKRFLFTPERKWVRYAVLALFVVAIIAGIQVFIALLAPYSAYGRIVRSFAGIGSGNTAWVVTAVAGVTLVAIFLCAWFWGRAYCNTVCPVGTVLSLFSRFSMFRMSIDPEACKHCHGCEKTCKAFCIDSAHQAIDYSRCVTCFDCIQDCKFGAIHYRFAWGKKQPAAAPAEKAEKADTGRRAFVAGSAFLIGAAALNAQNQGGLAPVLPKQDPGRSERLVPFGSGSVESFYAHCTACQLCISACPNHVLRPSTDLAHLMQPQMGYENGYCRPECTACSQVCPAGAIVPVKREEKFGIKIGTAVVDAGLCIGCGNCTRHCPTGAVTLIDKDGKSLPVVAEAQCIGCGACEYLCPTRPVSAIRVNGISVHQKH